MNVTLRKEDALAVDLLLDRSSAASHGDGGGQMFVSAADGVSPERVHSAEKVLGLLKLMPVDEPARDLLARTMGRLQEVSGHRVIVEPVIHSPRPHA